MRLESLDEWDDTVHGLGDLPSVVGKDVLPLAGDNVIVKFSAQLLKSDTFS